MGSPKSPSNTPPSPLASPKIRVEEKDRLQELGLLYDRICEETSKKPKLGLTVDDDNTTVLISNKFIESYPMIAEISDKAKIMSVFSELAKGSEEIKLRYLFLALSFMVEDKLDRKIDYSFQYLIKDSEGCVKSSELAELFYVLCCLELYLKEENLGKTSQAVVKHKKTARTKSIPVLLVSSTRVKDKISSKKKQFGGTSMRSFYDNVNSLIKSTREISVMKEPEDKADCFICGLVHGSISSDVTDISSFDNGEEASVAMVHELYREQEIGIGGKVSAKRLIQFTHLYSPSISVLIQIQKLVSQTSQWKEEKMAVVTALSKAKLRKDDACYILSSKWWQLWAEYTGFYSIDDIDPESNVPPGPIDNFPLVTDSIPLGIHEFFPIRLDIIDNDYVILPRIVWDMFCIWYGGGPEISRQVIEVTEPSQTDSFRGQNPNPRKNIMNLIIEPEMFPLIFEIRWKEKPDDLCKCIVSRGSTISQLMTAACVQLDLDVSKEYSFFVSESEDGKRIPLESVVNDDLNEDQEQQQQPTVDNIGLKNGGFIFVDLKQEIVEIVAENQEAPAVSGYNEGLVGLTNMGNTCYLNAALQSLMHLKVMTEYFLGDQYVVDMNKFKHREFKLVKTYRNLVKEVFRSADNNVITPRNLKSAISKISSQFAGFSQHDSQELLGLCLDALHEDLNQVDKKEYVQNPDWNGEDEEYFASIYWKNHLKRNQSFLVSLLQGQLKSITQCNQCSHKSIKFDPFLFLTLPVNENNFRGIPVIVMPLSSPSYNMKVFVSSNGLIQDLIKACNVATGTKCDYLVAEIQSGYIFRIYKKSKLVSSISDGDKIYMYECSTPNFKRVDSEIDIETCGIKGRSIYGAHTRIHFVHQKTKEKWFSTKHKISAYGHPLIHFFEAPVDQPFPASELYRLVADRLEKVFLINLENMNEIKIETKSKQKDFSQSVEWLGLPYPFVLRLVNRNGTSCRVCGNSSCSGCALLFTNDKITLGWDDTFAIDWAISKHKNRSKEIAEIHYCITKIDREKEQASFNNNEQDVSLFDCLDKFFESETLGEQEWWCRKCQNHNPATRSISISRLPNVLIVHLNRFKQNGWAITKNTCMVNYPLELDLTRYFPAEEPVYSLESVICHLGDVHGGHYVSLAKAGKSGKWYLFDDDQVSEIDLNDALQQSGYILFYQRMDRKGTTTTS